MDVHHQDHALTDSQKQAIAEAWPTYHNILIVAGQNAQDTVLTEALNAFFAQHNIPIVGDIISNLHGVEKLVRYADLFLGQASGEVKRTLQPDLLITFGQSVISKNLKVFLRNAPPKAHWHIQPAGIAADTFQTITQIFQATPASFFGYLATVDHAETFENQKQNNYNKFWEVEERRALRTLTGFFPQKTVGELEVVHEVLRNLPQNATLHLANSMSVRYANYIGLAAAQKGITVVANRGTSGIDGCTSTAVGHALASDNLNILITGDLAFFYDRNAFWHNYALPNLRVLLLNNHGGIIFSMIDGPRSLPEAEEYFVTHQKLNAKKLCEEFNIDYLRLDNKRKLKNLIKDFFEADGKTKIMELESDSALNKVLFENLKQKIKTSYEL